MKLGNRFIGEPAHAFADKTWKNIDAKMATLIKIIKKVTYSYF